GRLMGIPIARIFGIEIRVQFGWAIVLALVAFIAVGQLTAVDPTLEDSMAWILGGIVAVGFFISSVSHDLAHALVARRRGIDVRSIGVSFFGGATPLDPSSPDPGDDAAIAASGPLVSLAIGGVFFGLLVIVVAIGHEFSAAAGVLSVLVFLNLVLGLVNLVPAYPLDGGRIVRDLAWRRSGSERSGWRAAWRSGRMTGLVVIGVGIVFLVSQGDMTGAFIALTGWFFVLSSNSVRDRIRLDDLVGGRLVRDAMEEVQVTVHPNLTVDTFAAQLLDGETPLNAVPVTDGSEIVGMLGVSQVRRLRRSEWPKTRVVDVMVKPPRMTFLSPAEPLRNALERIYKGGIDGLPVVEDGKLLGVLTKRGIGMFIHGRPDGETAPVPGDPTPPTP
ncbi:MAG: site-2 protease family protein, partial [Chloroflexota bacterium]